MSTSITKGKRKENNWIKDDNSVAENLILLSDPFYRFLRKKLNLNLITAYLLFSIIPLSFESIFCYFRGCLDSNSGFVGMWNDYLALSYYTLLFPVIFTLYVWLPRGIDNIFNSLLINDIIHPTNTNKQSLVRFEKYQKRLFENRIWFILVIILSITIDILLILPASSQFNVWWNQSTITIIFHHIMHIIVLYCAIFSVIRITQFILQLRYFFDEVSIDIKSLHPDGCGGLKELGGFSVKLGYVLGAIGTSVILTVYIQSFLMGGNFGELIWGPALILFILVYTICAPLTFFVPIGTAHQAMLEAKERELLMISRQFELDYDNMMKRLPSSTNTIKKELEKIEQLKRLYNIVQGFPVWPFNYQNVLRFVISVLGPFILSVLPTIIEIII